jgi:hypothetical protein
MILWTDSNHDGKSQEDELQSLEHAGIQRIDLTSRGSVNRSDNHGNSVKSRIASFPFRGAGASERGLFDVQLARRVPGR